MAMPQRDSQYDNFNRLPTKTTILIISIIIAIMLSPKVYYFFLSKSHEEVREYLTQSSELVHKGQKYIVGEMEKYNPTNANQYVKQWLEAESWYRETQLLQVPKNFEVYHDNLDELMHQYYVLADTMANPNEDIMKELNAISTELNRLIAKDRTLLKLALEKSDIDYVEHADGHIEYYTYFNDEIDRIQWERELGQFEYYQDIVID